jgi:hypothetical protein
MELKFEREPLYHEVWTTPITTLAKKYGLSDNGLRKVCAALAIPLPRRGHWAKVAAGYQLGVPLLPATDGRTSFVCRLPDAESSEAPALRRDAGLQERLAFEGNPKNAVVALAELAKPHRLVTSAVPVIRAEVAGLQRSRDYVPPRRKPDDPWEIDWAATAKPNWRDYEQRGVMELDEDVLPVRVSIEAVDRALRIWDALLHACEARGMRVSAASRQVKISDGTDYVGLRMSEKVDRITRPAAWGGEQTVRRTPTGCLRMFVIHLGETKFEDTPERPLEAQLNSILVWIHRSLASQRTGRAVAAEKKQAEEATARIQAEERAAAAEAARLREEEIRKQQAAQAAEAERERLLMAEANAWRDAAAIRAYTVHLKTAAAIGGAVIAPALMEWLTWADAFADKLDPTSTRLLPDV